PLIYTLSLHDALPIFRDRAALTTSPARGNSFEGFMIEQILALENLSRPGSAGHFYRTHTGTEVDLLLDRGQSRLGFEFKSGAARSEEHTSELQSRVNL